MFVFTFLLFASLADFPVVLDALSLSPFTSAVDAWFSAFPLRLLLSAYSSASPHCIASYWCLSVTNKHDNDVYIDIYIKLGCKCNSILK